MNKEEFMKQANSLKKGGFDNKRIVEIAYTLYERGDLSKKDLLSIADSFGMIINFEDDEEATNGMTHEQFMKFVEESKAKGYTEEDILGTILQMFKDGKITLEDMKKMGRALGYELSDKFLKSTEGIDRMPSKK